MSFTVTSTLFSSSSRTRLKSKLKYRVWCTPFLSGICNSTSFSGFKSCIKLLLTFGLNNNAIKRSAVSMSLGLTKPSISSVKRKLATDSRPNNCGKQAECWPAIFCSSLNKNKPSLTVSKISSVSLRAASNLRSLLRNSPKK